jgi:hypothetical protein
VAAIDKRTDEIKKMISGFPAGKRVPSNMKFKKLWLENRLLGWKRAMYQAKGPDTPLQVMMATLVLQATDRWPSVRLEAAEAARCKSDQITTLLEFELHDKDDAQLQRLVDDQ